MTPDDVRRAAELLRARAMVATPGPWYVAEEIDGVYSGKKTVVCAKPTMKFGPRRVVTVGQTRQHHENAEANVAFIAMMHPMLANQLVDLLVAAARDADRLLHSAMSDVFREHEVLPITVERIARLILDSDDEETNR